MEKITEYRTMDAIFPNIQKTTISMGAVSRSSRQFQSWTRSRNRTEKTMPQRRAMLSCKFNEINTQINFEFKVCNLEIQFVFLYLFSTN